jgi:hypothetical protein
MAITEQDRQVLQANEGHMLTAKDGWVQQVYDLTKLHEIYERNVAHYPLTTWCPSCVIKFMQRLGTWWDGVKLESELRRCPNVSQVHMCTCKDNSECSVKKALKEPPPIVVSNQSQTKQKRRK